MRARRRGGIAALAASCALALAACSQENPQVPDPGPDAAPATTTTPGASTAPTTPGATSSQSPTGPNQPTSAPDDAATETPGDLPTSGSTSGQGGSPSAEPTGPVKPKDPIERKRPRTFSAVGHEKLSAQALAIEHLPATSDMLIVDKKGRLLLRPVNGGRYSLEDAPEVSTRGEGGLLDVAVRQRPVAEDGWDIYLSWVERDKSGKSGVVVGRAALRPGRSQLIDLRELWRETPLNSSVRRYGGQLAVSPDGSHVFVALGDRGKPENAQSMKSMAGKVVRLSSSGGPASGNPYAKEGGWATAIWAKGFRRPTGMGFDADGRLWLVDEGEIAGDELNLVLPGKNYGWPKVGWGERATDDKITRPKAHDGLAAARLAWGKPVAPSGWLQYEGEAFPEWNGKFLTGSSSGRRGLLVTSMDGAKAEETTAYHLPYRVQDVTVGPEGHVWLLTKGKNSGVVELVPND